MTPSLLKAGLAFISCAWLARCLDVPLNLYTSVDCKTPSSITPTTASNLSTCIVTPGLVSLHYGIVPCAGGGTVVPHLFEDVGCAKQQSVLKYYKTGSDLHCLSDFPSDTIAAIMLSCDRGPAEQPQATRTVSVGVVATNAPPASTTSASSSADGKAIGDFIIEKAWNSLSLGARIGIIVGGIVVALALCIGLCLCVLKCIGSGSRSRQKNNRRQYANDAESTSHPSFKAPDNAYLQVLDNVVETARQHAASGYLDNASAYAHGFATYADALPANVISAAFAIQDADWTHKVGAAGELYMFEYLQSLSLPSFGLQNWTSSLRSRVAAHPAYQNMHPARDGIADIEYFDGTGVFTEFLLGLGYSEQGIRRGMRPTYRFEVKATTSTDWQKPFYMSANQERHIRDALITSGQPDEVYIICRIVGLGRGSETRLDIYLDPEALRREGRLRFSRNAGREEEPWTVQPV